MPKLKDIFKRPKRIWEEVPSTDELEEDYESLESEEGKAGDTPLEQTPLTDKDSIHLFLYYNQENPLSIRTISENVGITPYHVRKNLKNLIDEGHVEQPESRRGKGAMYKVLVGPTYEGDVPLPSPKDVETMQTVINMQEVLVWDFIRATRSTNVLDYLEWLRKDKNGL